MPRNYLKRFADASKTRVLALTKAIAAGLTALMLIAGCAHAVKPEEKPEPWPTYLGNFERSNSTAQTLTMPLAVSWTADVSPFKFYNVFPKEQLSSPAISGGVVYVGSTDNSFYALSADNGSVLWKYDAGYPLEAPATVTSGHVFFGSSDGVLRCLKRTDGSPVWSHQAKSEILSAPVVRDGKLYFSSADGRLTALAENNGEKLWSYARPEYKTVTERLYVSPVFSDGRIYQLFSDGVIVSLDAVTGRELWTRRVVADFDRADQTRRTPLPWKSELYMIDEKGFVQSYSAATGEPKGFYNFMKAADIVFVDAATLVIAGADSVVAIDTVKGSILWKSGIKYGTLSTVLATGAHLMVISNYTTGIFGSTHFEKTRGYVQALDAKTGKSVWTAELKDDITASPAAGGFKLAVITNKGIIEVFTPR